MPANPPFPEFAAEDIALPWRGVLETAQWGIAIGNARNATLHYVNPCFAAMHGYETAEELIGRPIADVFAPSVRPSLPSLFNQIHNGEHHCFESEHVRKDGSLFPVRIDATTIRDTSGNAAYRVANVLDISRQVAEREELRVSKEFFRRTFTEASVAMAIADLDGRYISVNASMCALLGYSEPELLKLTYRDITHPDDVEANDKKRDELVTGAVESFAMEKRYVRKNGQVVWALTVVSVIKGPDGKAMVTLGQMLDIDRLKRTELALRESEARLEEAQQLAHLGSWTLDIPSGALLWSDEVFRLFELDPSAFKASYPAFLDAIHPEDRDAVDAAYTDSLRTRSPYEITHRLLMADGRIKWVTERCETEFDATGTPLRSIGTIQDVTAQKAAERALEESSNAYRSILSSARDGFWAVAPNGRLLDVNQRYCEISGYSRDELLGMSIPELEAKETATETADHIRQVIGDGSDIFETRHRRKDGSVWDVEVSTVSDVAGGHRLYAFLRDISERKAAAVALHESHDLLNGIINTAPIRVFWKDRDLRFLGCNQAFAQDAGKTNPADLVGKSDYEMSWTTEADMYRADDREVIESGIPRLSYEEPQTTPLGRRIWLRTSKVPLRNRDNEIIGVLGVYQDITQSKHDAEEVLRSHAQIRSLAARQERMLEEERKRIAHEIHDELGQQLSMLKLDTALLRRGHGDDPEILKLVQQMRDTIDHAIDVVRQVASNLRPAALDLGIVAAIEWLTQEFTERWGVDCEVDADGDIALGDALATVVFRVTQESLTNVVRHSGARHVRIRIRRDGDTLRLAVIDDGRGFTPPEPEMEKGFGLAGMRERVIAQGGSIEFQSQPGAGTSVLVSLPIISA